MSTKYSTIFPVIFFVLALPLTAPGAKEKPSEATIWPGESYTFEDVTVTWKAPAKRKTETSFGELTFETRGQKSWTVELKENTQAYFNDVYFYLELQMRERSKGIAPGTKLFMRAYHEPSTRFIGGKEGETRAHVSLACPITVNDWEFRVSEKKRPYKDGGEYYQLLGQNRSTGEEQALPFLNGTRRKFGRFDVVLHYTCQSTRTAELVIHYKRDLTQRGRGAYVKDFWVHRDERTLGRLFEIMGERFGFDVEWPQAIEHPEAIETAMATGYTLNPPSNTDVGTGLQDLIHRSRQMSGGPYRPRLKLTWVDDTHLRVEAERIEEIAEQIREKKDDQKRLEENKARFEEEYKLITRVYKLRTIGVASAKALVERELSTHFLSKGGSVVSRPDPNMDEEALMWHRAISDYVAQEKVIADEGQNALLVIAIPTTHDKIDLLLARTDAVLSMEAKHKSAAVPSQYRIELILLRGGKAGEPVERKIFTYTWTSSTSGDGDEETGAEGPTVSSKTYSEPGVKHQAYSAELAKKHGIGKEDMELFGFDGVAELGKALVALHGEKGAVGQAVVALPNGYRCKLSFEDLREPYLVVKCSLLGGEKKPRSRTQPKKKEILFKADEEPVEPADDTTLPALPTTESAEPLLENTLFLKANEPTLLGLTNLREALILVLRLRDTPKGRASRRTGR